MHEFTDLGCYFKIHLLPSFRSGRIVQCKHFDSTDIYRGLMSIPLLQRNPRLRLLAHCAALQEIGGQNEAVVYHAATTFVM
jgi:hypothetical protein